MSYAVTPLIEKEGGKFRYSLRNSWKKLVECQERVKFWQKMLEGGLGVRELECFGEDLRAKYRSEVMKKGGSEREAVKLSMILKLRDDKRHQVELKKERKMKREVIRR